MHITAQLDLTYDMSDAYAAPLGVIIVYMHGQTTPKMTHMRQTVHVMVIPAPRAAHTQSQEVTETHFAFVMLPHDWNVQSDASVAVAPLSART